MSLAISCRLTAGRILYNHTIMEPSSYISRAPNLDAVFAALADPTRRAILARLSVSEASVTELAAPFPISQPAISKHLKVLENAGLVARRIDRQRRLARLQAEPMAGAVTWLEEFRQFWSGSFDQLDGLLDAIKAPHPKGSPND
jgi:DNA-binding transcriptional ArsR family regulator